MARVLIIEPEGGLANRLRAILTAAVLAREGKRELQVLWQTVPGSHGMRASLDDLFDCHPKEIKSFTPHCDCSSLVHVSGSTRLPTVDPCVSANCIYVKTCYPVASPSQLNGARSYLTGAPVVYEPLHELTRRATSVFNELFTPNIVVLRYMDGYVPQDRTGIHIRQGDNRRAIQVSPLDMFGKRLKSIPPPFWLSTDSAKVEEWVLTLGIGDCRWMKKKYSIDPRGRYGVQLALADLLLLSKTKQVFGSGCSSFGPLAAALGGIRFEMVGMEVS